jgi:hypothetical protein
MIEKELGVSKLNKLCALYLFEADYNLLLKCMWVRKAVWNSHNKKSIEHGSIVDQDVEQLKLQYKRK